VDPDQECLTLYFADAAEWRAWLLEHHQSETEVWLGFWKVHTGHGGITNAQAVDQALCFGWIDAQMHRVDEERWRKRFTLRRPGSIWSNVNLRRFAELEQQGLVAEAGLAAYRRRTEGRQGVYAYENEARELPEEYAGRLAADPVALEFWRSARPSYRKLATSWVVSAKRPETRERRMQQLLEDCRAGRLIKSQRYGRRN
jgi:uncharacterized protein YdeI (YjbR/CyaY-like superfamily)